MSKNVENFVEYFGPNYLDDGRTYAKYKRNFSTETYQFHFGKGNEYLLTLPTKLQVINITGQWMDHPRLYLSHQDPDALARQEGEMIFILADQHAAKIPFQQDSYSSMLKLYKQFYDKGLTSGYLTNIKSFPKK